MFNAFIKRTVLTIILVGGLVGVTPVLGSGVNEKQRQTLNNLQHELSHCAMFYKISEQGMKKKGSAERLEVSKRSAQLSNQMMVLALTIGKTIGMNQKAFKARFQMSYDSMMDEMDNNFVNYSILLQKNLSKCTQLSKGFKKRIENVMNQ